MEDVAFTLSELRFPAMRRELVSALKDLSDTEAHSSYLSDDSTDGNDFDSRLAIAVHFLFDDTQLKEDPESHIGFFLVDREEAAAINKLILALDPLLGEQGSRLDSDRLLRHPRWAEIAEMSLETLDVLGH